MSCDKNGVLKGGNIGRTCRVRTRAKTFAKVGLGNGDRCSLSSRKLNISKQKSSWLPGGGLMVTIELQLTIISGLAVHSL